MDSTVPVEIIDYEDRYKQDLEDISLPWLLEYDLLEPVDLEMLAAPSPVCGRRRPGAAGPLRSGDCGYGDAGDSG